VAATLKSSICNKFLIQIGRTLDVQKVHTLHREFFGIVVFVLAEVFQRAYIKEGCNRHEAAAFAEVAPDKQFLIDFFYILNGKAVFFYDTVQFAVLQAVVIDFCRQVFILQVVTIFFNQAAIDVGAAQKVVHFQQEDDGQDSYQQDKKVIHS